VWSERERLLPVSPASHRNLAGVDGDGRNGTSRIYMAESQHNLAGDERDFPSKRQRLAVEEIGSAGTYRR
jgi:hypothetical protein